MCEDWLGLMLSVSAIFVCVGEGDFLNVIDRGECYQWPCGCTYVSSPLLPGAPGVASVKHTFYSRALRSTIESTPYLPLGRDRHYFVVSTVMTHTALPLIHRTVFAMQAG